ncbi:anti-sigma regulatory factor [Imhoffiella purpurea]|uniref:Anti-sigma B factor RsbT n=1 Tax=Imhoffiella purpurea TaxID=1249627 RepID=W9V3M3_9GAMM|nr:anti-sigma regulatory factor [Imhoffiella purpurea]EXJ13914.1 anti-sigma B factor RsbT [Imhoffiella purpurea]
MMQHQNVPQPMPPERPADPIPSWPPSVASVCVRVETEPDIAAACREIRWLAERMGFARSPAYYLATAASELATNLLIHAGGGWLRAASVAGRHPNEPPGIELVAEDAGPGIADLALALTEGYSTAGGLGCGLPGVERLMDVFAMDSRPGHGTRVRAIKWP